MSSRRNSNGPRLRQRAVVIATLILLAVAGGLTIVLGGTARQVPSPTPSPPTAAASPPSRSPAASGTPTGSAAPDPNPPVAAGPPPGSKHIASRYRVRYHGQYASWDTLIAYGEPLPGRSDRCRTAWQQATKDPKLDWDRAGYLCLAPLTGNGFKPQGVTGTSMTAHYRIGNQPATRRNLILISSYSPVAEPSLRFPNQPGRTDATQLTVIDLDQRRYNQVELVKPTASGALTALNSHGSGVAWAGQYLYSSNRVALYQYNADDLMFIDGRFVLPATARWAVTGKGGLSTLTITRSGGQAKSGNQAQLRSITYGRTGTSWTHTFELTKAGDIRPGPKAPTVGALQLTRDFGPVPAIVRNQAASTLPGINFQGLGISGKYRLVNSSSTQPPGRPEGDYLLIFRGQRMLSSFLMPAENLEGIHTDLRRNRYLTITEHGQQFLFWFPLDYLIEQANTG